MATCRPVLHELTALLDHVRMVVGLFDLGADCVTRFGAPYWMVHRGDFHRVLIDAVEALAPGTIKLGSNTKIIADVVEHIP